MRQKRRDRWLFQRWTARTLGGIVGVASVATGCTFLPYPRVNHYHSDANQKLAEEAADRFESFTGDTAGLAAVLDRNLEARRALATTVSETRLQVLDPDLARVTTDLGCARRPRWPCPRLPSARPPHRIGGSPEPRPP